MKISLEDVRRMAMQNNLEIRVDLLNPTIAQQSLSAEEAAFEALVRANGSYSRTDQPSATANNQVFGSGNETWRLTPGLTLPLRTGGTIDLDVPMSQSTTDFPNGTPPGVFNPSYSSDFTASISQPLMRGAGVETNTHRLRIASYNYQISQAQTKLDVIRVLADTERAYWRLYAAREDLEVRRKQYESAYAQLERARRQVQFGAAAEVEVVRAESGLADTVEGIITADNTVRDRQRTLKRVINQPGLEMDTETILVPATLPRPIPYRLDPQQLAKTAINQRMEMLELELQILQDASSVAFARNGTLPLVALSYRYNVNGLGASPQDSFALLEKKHFEDHSLGLQVQVPVGNEAARSELRRALLIRMQDLANKDQRTLTVQQEVYSALDQLQTNWQRILAAQKRTLLNARLLDAEVRQFDQQLRTSTDVLVAQSNLASAQSAEIAAITDYQISQVDLAFATGMVLGESSVSWDQTPPPAH
jgi:outer membrane protein TolC